VTVFRLYLFPNNSYTPLNRKLTQRLKREGGCDTEWRRSWGYQGAATLTCRQESDELSLSALLFSGLSARPALFFLCRIQLAPHGTEENKNRRRCCARWKGNTGRMLGDISVGNRTPTGPSGPTKPLSHGQWALHVPPHGR
jgi:hypothetical protein